MITNGVVLIARNNSQIDYVKQAVFSAIRIKKYLDLPVSIITDSVDYLKNNFDYTLFDKIIQIEYKETKNVKIYHDGSISYKTISFKNDFRHNAYWLSPYDKTLLIDTDYIISNDLLKNCFNTNESFLIYKASEDIAKVRDETEFKYISDNSVDFYWATVVYFVKNKINDIFFNLISHIQDEWNHYRRVYQINSSLFRNDFAFSIAIHIMNGFTQGEYAKPLPGKHLYTIDKDILWQIENDELMFLVEKANYLGEYTAMSTKGLNVHVMNKFSLDRIIDKVVRDGSV